MRDKVFFAILFATTLAGCSSGDLEDTKSAEGAFKAAERYDNDERWEDAAQKYQEVQNKHPYSRFATLAKLRLADVHYKKESFIEAQHAYESFKDLHPKHPQIDYVTFRLGMSYFNQLPGTIDRDLSAAHKSILYFDEVINSYPSSPHVEEAKVKRNESRKMLAEKENYIARFYFIRDMYDSALKRYEKILTTYPETGFEAAALYGATMSALKTGDREKAKNYASKLEKQYPDSSETRKARSELEDDGIR